MAKEWTDTGIVLAAKPFGENDAILDVITPTQGRHSGFVRGGRGRRKRGLLQGGNILHVTWKARLENQLGGFAIEIIRSPLGNMFADSHRLMALSAAVSVLAQSLPERDPHQSLYEGLEAFLGLLEADESTPAMWGEALVRLEYMLLKELGYGLDFSACAATGVLDDLIYVSPKSGRAVSREAGKPYHDKLLSLPAFLLGEGPTRAGLDDVVPGLQMTGFFLTQQIWAVHDQAQPPSRDRFVHWLGRQFR